MFSEPLRADPAKPDPNSIPLTAGMPKTAEAMRFSIPQNSGEPSPAGSPVTAHSTVPPTESPSAAAFFISLAISRPRSSSMTGGLRDAASSNSSFEG